MVLLGHNRLCSLVLEAVTTSTLLLHTKYTAVAVIGCCKAGDLDLRLTAHDSSWMGNAAHELSSWSNIMTTGLFSQGYSDNSLMLETTDLKTVLAQLKLLHPLGTAVDIKPA